MYQIKYFESSKILIEKINILKNDVEEIKKKYNEPYIDVCPLITLHNRKMKEIERLEENLKLAFKIENLF